MDAMRQRLKILFIATTNRPADIDEGFMRRFHKLIYVGLPDPILGASLERSRGGIILKIWKAQLAVYDQKKGVTNENLHQLATQMASMRTLSADDVTRAVEIRVFATRTQRIE